MVNLNTTAAKWHDLSSVKFKVGGQWNRGGVGRMHAEGRVSCLLDFGQSTDVIRMPMSEQDGHELRAGDGSQQRIGVITRIHKQGVCLAAIEDIAVRLVNTYWDAEYVHLMTWINTAPNIS
jgi:hypothetical protein